jgi:hypothetical protein
MVARIEMKLGMYAYYIISMTITCFHDDRILFEKARQFSLKPLHSFRWSITKHITRILTLFTTKRYTNTFVPLVHILMCTNKAKSDSMLAKQKPQNKQRHWCTHTHVHQNISVTKRTKNLVCNSTCRQTDTTSQNSESVVDLQMEMYCMHKLMIRTLKGIHKNPVEQRIIKQPCRTEDY